MFGNVNAVRNVGRGAFGNANAGRGAFGNANTVRNVGRGPFGNTNMVWNVGRGAFGNANAGWNTRKQTVFWSNLNCKFKLFLARKRTVRAVLD